MWYDYALTISTIGIALAALVVSIKKNKKDDMNQLIKKIDNKAERTYVDKRLEKIEEKIENKAGTDLIHTLTQKLDTMDQRVFEMYKIIIEKLS